MHIIYLQCCNLHLGFRPIGIPAPAPAQTPAPAPTPAPTPPPTAPPASRSSRLPSAPAHDAPAKDPMKTGKAAGVVPDAFKNIGQATGARPVEVNVYSCIRYVRVL